MKKLLSVFLALAMIVTMIPGGILFASAEQSGDYTYTVIDEKAKITDYTGSGTSVSIPGTLGGYPVTTIGSLAFAYCYSITSVTIPDSVITIENSAFYWSINIVTVNIGTGLATLGTDVFFGGRKISQFNVTVGNPVFSSDAGVLFNADKSTLMQFPPAKTGAYTVPATVTTIAAESFRNSTLVTSITVGAGVVTIGANAFAACSALTQINVNEGNAGYSSLDGVLFDKNKTVLIQYPSGKSGSYTVPGTVGTIGDYAFGNANNLLAVDLPASLTTIGSYAFYYCPKLTTVTIPDTVIEIGNYAFSRCIYITSFIIGSGVETIGAGAFSSCIRLAEINIPDNVLTIGAGAFLYCDLLTNVSIGQGVNSIGGLAFSSCKSMFQINVAPGNNSFCSLDGVLFDKDVNTLIKYPETKQGIYFVPQTVTVIEEFAFFQNTGVTAVELPAVTGIIGKLAFSWCENLKWIKVTNEAVLVGEDAFDGSSKVTVIAPSGSTAQVYANGNGIPFAELAESILIVSLPDKTMYPAGEPLDFTGFELIYIDGTFNITTVDAYDVQGFDTNVFGKQTLTVSYNGFDTFFDVTVTYISSDHPYQNDMDQSWTYTHPEPADFLAITFSAQTYTEEDCDYIYIYDAAENLMGAFSGDQLQNKTVLVPGNSFRIQLTSDYSQTEYGFDIISIVKVSTVLSSSHPYDNDMDESWSYTHPEPAEKLKIIFSDQTSVEEGYDFIYIYDSNDDLVGTYTGNMLAGRTLIVDGNSFRIRLTSDGSVTEYGFDIVSVESFDSVISSEHPYNNDVDISWHYEHPATVTYLELTFSPETSLENGYDYIFIYDENDDLVGSFTGLELAGAVVTVFGSSFTVQLTSDSSHTDYGFDILSVVGFDGGGALLTPAEGSGCVVDSDNGFIYGLATGITSLNGHAEIPEGYTLEIEPTPFGLGTGAVVNVRNSLTEEIVETYTVIIFGDVNGDGNIDSADAGKVVDVENYLITWDPVADAAYRMAGDVNADGNTDSTDAGAFVDYENYKVTIDQGTGIAS